jgi:hypothetical protein
MGVAREQQPDQLRGQPYGRPYGRHGGPGRIELEIGELVLDGFTGVDHDRVAAAFRRELARLLAGPRPPSTERGSFVAAAADDTIDVVTGLPALPATASPRRLGQALARIVHGGLAEPQATSGASGTSGTSDTSGTPAPEAYR